MDDRSIVALYWDRSETAIAETDKKYGPYCYSIAHNILELLPYGAQGLNYQTLDAETPLVLSEVDYILMGDGTVIPVPAQ